MKSITIPKLIALLLVFLMISGCNLSRSRIPNQLPTSVAQTLTAFPTALPTQPIPGQQPTPAANNAPILTPTPSEPSAPTDTPVMAVTQLPTQAQAATATATQQLPTLVKPPTATASQQPPKSLPTSTPAPRSTPTSLPTTAPSASAPTTIPVQGSYAVILVPQGDKMAAHTNASLASSTAGQLAYNEKNLTSTGKQTQAGLSTWIQLNLPSGGQGWVNRNNLTEYVAPDAFCKDPQVDQLIGSLIKALQNKDSSIFPALVSPVHGLSLQEIRGGTVANYDLAKAAWVLQSTYVVDWGKAPGSGQAVHGTFSQVVLPDILNVLTGQYTKTCNKITLGGATYQVSWPSEYENVNFVSLYLPAPAGKDQDWRTWLLGVEYVGGKPYLFSLNQYAWEP